MNKPPLVILAGPTAVGKTKTSIALAKAINGEIISADSMQVYRCMNIGSAKITAAEMQGVPHHLLDILNPDEEFNVAVFQALAKECMKGIYERGRTPIIVGGTGFYIQALLYDIDFDEGSSSGSDAQYRKALELLAQEQGIEVLHQMLAKVDPASAQVIHANNKKRVIRALEFYHQTGIRISDHNEKERTKESPYHYAYFVLTDVRERLYRNIEGRVDQMLRDGLTEEVRQLKEMGCHAGMISMKGLGYQEMLSYLEGTITLAEAVDLIKKNTRHFAKRQLTWFKREPNVIWIDKSGPEYVEGKILAAICGHLKEKRIV